MARPPLSVQLYSIRDLLDQDPAAALADLAGAGFASVEPFGLAGFAERLAAPLAELGLAAPTAHTSLVGADIDAVLSAARLLGVETAIEPAVHADRWGSRESIAEVAAELNRIADRAADEGVAVGYHNHWWELESRIDGTPALEVFADLLDERVVLEVDAYWVAVGGVEPVALVERLGDRVAALHVKDGPISRDTKAQQPVGRGAMPWPELLLAAPDARLVVEFDDYAGDVVAGILAARAWLVVEGSVE